MSAAADAPPPGDVGALRDLGVVHLIGIGGAGMSVVADLLAARGVPVQGSDAQDGPALAGLRARGLRVWVGHDEGHVAGADTVVVSTAVRDANPELAAARARGLRVLHRSQALAALMAGGRSVAVAGAHGKTTTSAMIATILAAAGLDPSFAIGGTVLTAAGALPGGRLGGGDVLVAEADESDGSFLNYAPTVAVVTNVEPDHLDFYGSRAAFEQAFVDFTERIVPGGTLVACADDPGAAALAAGRPATERVVTYGTAPGAAVRLGDIDPAGRHAVLTGPGLRTEAEVPLDLLVPGVHNLLNAAGAVAVAVALGVDAEVAARGAAGFRGTGRRFEARGAAGGVRVVDDYAHHPTEIAALLAAARTQAAPGRVLVLFQPHLYSRTRLFAREFARALAAADVVVVTGVYRAREDVDPSVGPWTITDHMAGAAPGAADADAGAGAGAAPGGAAGRAIEDRFEAAAAVADAARPGDLVLTVGAGDVTELGPWILDRLAARADGPD